MMIVIIGSGFSGLAAGIKLREAGIDDFTILEAEDGVGGTWRVNHYPGAACDIKSNLYSFSFEPNPQWSRTYPTQPEILAYLERVADKHDLRRHCRFDTRVVGARFDEAAAQWELTTDDDRTLRADLVISGTGGLSRPSTPSIPGAARFAGASFHSARWDHATPLAGKTVGLIGTGASAIQIAPKLAAQVGRLHIFQRTPPWIVPHPDRPVGERERRIYRALPLAQRIVRAGCYWQNEWRALAFTVEPRILVHFERQVRAYIAQSVPDRDLRARVTPDYRLGCKRVLLSNDWYPTLQRDNVELVTDPIREIDARGIVTVDGASRPLDAIVYCTGFQAADAVEPFPIAGRNGLRLADAWRDGAEAYLGTSVAGFPNWFMVTGPNSGLGHNSMVYVIEAQVRYIVDAIRTMRARRLQTVEVRADAQARYNRGLQARLARTVWNTGGCASWYRAANGKNTVLWPGFSLELALRTRRFDAAMYSLGSRRVVGVGADDHQEAVRVA